MPVCSVNGIDLYYEERGGVDALPLILMHGGMGAIDDAESGWADLVALFADRYHTFEIEHRGHGRTGNDTGTITYRQLTDDLTAFMVATGIGSAHLAGMSDGGIVALEMSTLR